MSGFAEGTGRSLRLPRANVHKTTNSSGKGPLHRSTGLTILDLTKSCNEAHSAAGSGLPLSRIMKIGQLPLFFRNAPIFQTLTKRQCQVLTKRQNLAASNALDTPLRGRVLAFPHNWLTPITKTPCKKSTERPLIV